METKDRQEKTPRTFETASRGFETLNPRLERYAVAHKRALSNADYIRENQWREAKRAHKIEKCGHWLVFRHYYTIDDLRLRSADFCKQHLLCPLCAIRRATKYLESYLVKYEHVKQERASLRPYLVTFTIKNGESLPERFNHLKNALTKLTQARRDCLKSPKRKYTEFSKAAGAVYSIEVKRGKNSGLWHPHAHMVWLCDEEPNQAALQEEWLRLTGDSHQVDVRPIAEDVTSGFIEVFKYALKFSDMAPEDNWEAFQALRGKRLVSSVGCLFGVKVPEDLTDELLDDLPFIDYFFKYIESAAYTFIKKDSPPPQVKGKAEAAAPEERRGPGEHFGAAFTLDQYRQLLT